MDVTEDIKKFVHDDVFRNSEYLFVSKEGNNHKGYCSFCNHEYEVINLDHNHEFICPKCKANLQVKKTIYGRKNCLNEACFYYFGKSIVDPNVIVCKGYYVNKDYTHDFKNPKVKFYLEAVYIFKDKQATMLTNSWWGKDWDKRASIFNFNQGWLASKMCHCSFESIKKTIQGTSFQYIPYKIFQGCYSMVKVFEEYLKHPWIEQICKIGFGNIIKRKLEGDHLYDCLNYKGKNVFQILKLNRKDVKILNNTSINITPLFLKFYQMQAKDHCGFSVAQVKDLVDTYGRYSYAIIKVVKYTTMKKAIKYLDKQFKNNKINNYTKSDFAINWYDYLDDCKKLKMNFKDDSVLFPKDVYKAHQNTIKQVKIQEDVILNDKISSRAKKLEKYCFEYNGLFIRPATSSNELIKEGEALNHCVGTYADRYATGMTNILFIRKTAKPNKSFYTLELKDDRVLQTRGLRNCAPTSEVKEFIEAFKKAKLVKKSKVKIPA